MELNEFIKDTPVDAGIDSEFSHCYGWGSGAGCFDGRGADGFGSGKCIELINGSGFGAGYGDGCGTVDGSGR